MTCRLCKGSGVIPGDWMPEQCPECNGPAHKVEDFDDDAGGCMVAAIGMGLAGAGAILWPVIQFLIAMARGGW